MTADTFLFDAGSLFFAAWIAVITVLTLAAFGRDLLAWSSQAYPAHKPRSTDQVRPSAR